MAHIWATTCTPPPGLEHPTTTAQIKRARAQALKFCHRLFSVITLFPFQRRRPEAQSQTIEQSGII